MNIDWSRVAEPQADGYDSTVLAHLLHEKFGWVKRTPPNGVPTLCNGHVAVTQDPHRFSGKYMGDWFSRPEGAWFSVTDVEPYLQPWTAGYQMLQLFLDEFWPKVWPADAYADKPEEEQRQILQTLRGSSSGHHEILKSHNPPKNAVYVTVNDPQGCAEGIYHEVGHLRLEAVGIGINDNDGRLIANRTCTCGAGHGGGAGVVHASTCEQELYDSPVRKDIKRPMCAVIQGLYAWLMLTESDLCIADAIDAPRACEYIIPNLPKIENGIAEVRRYARPTTEGEPFLNGMLAWADRIVDRGHQRLQTTLTPENYAKVQYARL